MNLDRIRQRLPAAVAARADTLHGRWVAEFGGDARDPSGFVAWLGGQGLIDGPELRELLAEASEGFTLDDSSLRVDAPAPGAGPRPTRRTFGLLGRGAMGEVHVAKDIHLSRNVAVKRLAARYRDDARIRERFENEVQITAQLEHPSIIPVYSFEPDDGGVPSYAMKLIRGRTLERWIEETKSATRSGQTLPTGRDLASRLEVFRSICAAVQYAHTRGVIHRDLKPDNVMIGAFDEVVVMDWGVARKIGGAPESIDTLVRAEPEDAVRTQLGVAIGTPTFMSPEQAQGRNDELDARSDQYALGLILFELVSLRRAITGDTVASKLFRASKGEKDPLSPLDPAERIAPGLAAVVQRATAIEPAARYADVAALSDDVRRYLRDEAVLARPDTAVEAIQRWVAHHRAFTVAGIFAGTSVLLALLFAALIGGVAAVEAKRQEAAVHEGRLASLIADVSQQAHQIDTELGRYQGLLGEVASAAEMALRSPPPGLRTYRSETFGSPEGPPDAARYARYPTAVSFEHPDVKLAPGLDPAALDARIRQLAGVQPTLREVMLRSANGELVGIPAKDVPARIGQQGVPMAWTYLATDDGLLVGFPGTGEYPDGYDPRTQPWYTAGAGRSARWTPASIDESGFGLLVTVTRGLYVDGRKVGVAAVDIGLDHLVDELLVPASLTGRVDAWLIDDAKPRRTIATSVDESGTVLPTFDDPTLVAALDGGQIAGHLESDDALWVWVPLPALGWTYVVRGRQLFDSTPP